MDVWATLIASAFGLLAGIVSGIWAPWAKHQIAVIMDRRKEQKAAVARWRQAAYALDDDACIAYQPWWQEVAPHLTPAEREACMPPGSLVLVIGKGGQSHRGRPDLEAFITALGRLEVTWKLI